MELSAQEKSFPWYVVVSLCLLAGLLPTAAATQTDAPPLPDRNPGRKGAPARQTPLPPGEQTPTNVNGSFSATHLSASAPLLPRPLQIVPEARLQFVLRAFGPTSRIA